MPLKDLVAFVLYIIPGFLALQIYRAVYPVKGPGEFTQTAWCIVYGVGILFGVQWLDAAYCGSSLQGTPADFPKPGFVLALVGGGVLVGGLLTGVHAAREWLAAHCPRLARLTPDPQCVWPQINRPSNRCWAVVFLDDGAIYGGYIGKYTFNPDAENQDFLLREARRIDENLKEQYVVDGEGVYLNTKHVRRIEFVQGSRESSWATAPAAALPLASRPLAQDTAPSSAAPRAGNGRPRRARRLPPV